MDKINSSLRDSIIAELETRGKVQRSNDGTLHFRCPLPEHEDKKASGWLRDHAWGCMGCGHKGSLEDLARILGVPLSNGDLTLEKLAKSKGFDPERLKKMGLRTVFTRTGKAVSIPYYGRDGKLLRCKIRTLTTSGKKEEWWDKDNPGGEPTYLYGLNMRGKKNGHRKSMLTKSVSGKSPAKVERHLSRKAVRASQVRM
jgi:hypothetical protein